MIELTKLNGEVIILNCDLIECIEMIPECKVTMTNGKYHIVRETGKEIIEQVVAYERMIFGNAIKRQGVEDALNVM